MKKTQAYFSILIIALYTGNAFSSTVGLNTSVWDGGVPYFDWSPTDADVTNEIAWMAATPATYSFVNSNDSFVYNQSGSVSAFFGADAAGNALTDNTSTGFFAFNSSGYINVSQSGYYIFNMSRADDAGRVSVDGSTIVENNFWNTIGPSYADIYLTAGAHLFDLAYFQTYGGSNLSFSAYADAGAGNSGSVSYSTSVPEPASIALLAVGMIALSSLRKKNHSGITRFFPKIFHTDF